MADGRRDGELMAAAGKGQAEAFQELVTRYAGRILPFLHRLVGDDARAQDLAQETFLRLYRRCRERTEDEVMAGSCASLIFTIAANLGRDELRRRKVRREVASDASLALQPAKGLRPDEAAQRKERDARVWRALDALPAETRAFLVWRDVQDMSYEEIAAVSGLCLGTVKSRINRARLAFKDAYLQADTPRRAGESS